MFNLVVLKVLQAPYAEVLHVERSHHRSMNHSSFQTIVTRITLTGQIPDETAGEGISRTGRIGHRNDRISGHCEIGVFRNECRTVLSTFYNGCARPQIKDKTPCFGQVVLVRQLTGLAVIDDQYIHLMECILQRFTLASYPKIHGVADRKMRLRYLAENF